MTRAEFGSMSHADQHDWLAQYATPHQLAYYRDTPRWTRRLASAMTPPPHPDPAVLAWWAVVEPGASDALVDAAYAFRAVRGCPDGALGART